MTSGAERLLRGGLLAAALLLAVATPGQAADKPKGKQPAGDFGHDLGTLPSAEDIKPTGPIDITADKLESSDGTSATYSGNVRLVSNTVKMDGDRLELKQSANRQYEARLYGNPAHMSHAGTGPDDPPVDAHAKTMIYDTRSGNVDLIGEAYVKKNTSTITAETVRYNVQGRSFNAERGSGGQIHITLPQDEPATTAPAPPASTPSAASKP